MGKTDLPRSDGAGSAKANPKTLAISGREWQLDAEGDHFVVRSGEGRPLRVPALRVRQVIVSNGARVRSAALKLALDAKVPVTFFGPRGELRGHLQPPLPP